MEIEHSELTTDRKGAIAETAIVHAAIKLGIDVYRPVAEGGRYDLIFDLESGLVRVQCKWASLVRGAAVVRCYSCRRTRDGMLTRPYLASEIDAVAAYVASLDRCLYFPQHWLGERRVVSVRVEPAKNNQRGGVNWLEDFAIERLRLEPQERQLSLAHSGEGSQAPTREYPEVSNLRLR